MNTLEAQETVQEIGQGIAHKLYTDGLWRVTAINALVQALEVLCANEAWVGLAYLEALQDYEKAAGPLGTREAAFGLHIPKAYRERRLAGPGW